MFLKTLSVAGFKSFADRTRLEFEPGVNVVVGPNGSGKSNLVDAVAWVLGTQATSALRTSKMDEVIFAGTALRPPHRRAEVSLTFDNSQGRLPLDLAEVTISRRLYRDGTADYEINGAACRLLDIQELLSDSGVGKHQHVVVGQGRIGSVLNARPEDHRAVIEEAAGVIKHRNRRDRAVRRLEQTELDVARLQDILSEQQRRMRPLKRQARAAEQHAGLKAEARALRLYIGGSELRRLRARLGEVEAELTGGEERIAAAEAEAAAVADSLGPLEEQAGRAGAELDRDTAAAARLETAIERLRGVASVARERRLSAESRLRGAGDRRRDLTAEREDLLATDAEAARDVETARAEAERLAQALAAVEDEERSLAEQTRLPAEGIAAALRGEMRALEAAATRDQREADAVEQRIAVVSDRIVDETTQADRLREEIRRLDSLLGKSRDAYQRTSESRDRAQRAWEAAEADRQDARMELVRCQARLEALEAVAEGLGDPDTARRLAERADITGAIAALLDIPDDLVPAVDAALGRWSGALVAESRDAVADAVADVKAAGGGGVPVLDPSGAAAGPAREVAARWGVEALVDRLGPHPLVDRLLGDVVLVEGWSAGWRLVERHPDVRVVTPEGDLITAVGIHSAVPDGAGPVALEASRAAVEAAEIVTARADSHHTTTRRAFDGARHAEREALEEVEAIEAKLAGATEALDVAARRTAEAEAELARMRERKRALDEATSRRSERIAAQRRRLDEFAGEEAEAQRAWEALTARAEELATRREAARRAREESAAALAVIEERRRIIERRLADIAQQLGPAAEPPAVEPADVDRLTRIEEVAAEAVEVCRGHVAALRDRQRALRHESGEATTRLAAARDARDRLAAELTVLRERTAALGIERAELRVRDEAVAEGLRRDADADEEEALAAPHPEVEGGTDLQARLDEVDGRLRRMGPVNPLAAAEYQELAERAEFLEEQLADLDESRRDLRKVIAALDEQIGAQFLEAFTQIAAFYEENFALLFPGGRGRLRLSDPDDLLGTGVEIEAQPMGKKVTRLSLLSGGERSLAALAFLFAVFRARPSPFYLLDEVEAALDDANLHRFIRLVDTLRGSAQLVIVTHQQHTMEAADILYGVTMEPGETSKVIAKRFATV